MFLLFLSRPFLFLRNDFDRNGTGKMRAQEQEQERIFDRNGRNGLHDPRLM